MSNNIGSELLKKIPKDQMKPLLDGYLEYAAKYKYLRYIILGVFATILCYNFFVAGKSFQLEQLQTIQTIFGGIAVLFLLMLIVLGVKLFKTLRALKKNINTVAERHHLDVRMVRKDFHVFVKMNIGGPGLR